MTNSTPDSLSLTLTVPDRIPVGRPVPFELRIENRRGRPLDLYLRGRTVTFDIEVTLGDGTVMWRRLEGEVIPAIIHLRTLGPGERITATATWDQRTRDGAAVAPGWYAARALLLVEGEPLATDAIRFRIGAG